MYSKYLLTILFIIFSFSSNGQSKHYIPVWSFHQNNITIDGISLGLWTARGHVRNTNTNGLKIEIGFGPLILLIGESPVADNDSSFLAVLNSPVSEKINGLSFSTATACDCYINGVSANFFGNYDTQVNGLSIGLMNFVQRINGIQIGFLNDVYEKHGIQIGIFNTSRKTKGFQIGLWNKNEKRKLPIINWNFKS